MYVIDTIVFLIFTGGVVLLGCSFFSKKRTSDEFTSAGRSLPGWVVGMSILATYVSSISYLAYPGKAYMSDWNTFVFSLSIPIASYFAVRNFVPFCCNLNSVSAYSFLEERFGVWARFYTFICYLLAQVVRMGFILYLLALPMNALLGWDIKTIIIVTSVAIIFYSMLGGLEAVIWTEAMSLSPALFTDGFWSAYKSPFHANLTIVFGTIIIFFVGFISANLFEHKTL